MKKNIQKLLPGVQKNFLLKKYTTFRIGGKVQYFFAAKNKKEIIKAVTVAKKLDLPFFILGRGSNLLVSDKGFKGIVINFQFSIFNFQKNKIFAGAGTPLGRLVNVSAEKSLTGLEWAIGIPGTIGGAVYGNAGAFGKSMKDIVSEVEIFDSKTQKIKIFGNKKCKFSYRNSIFKKNPNLIILSVVLKLKKGDKKTIKEKIQEYSKYRIKTQPLNFSSAGSIFKNPPGTSVGYLIEQCGLKGKRIGNVKISEKHANFIINLGKGKAKDVMKLIKLIKKEIKKKFKIELEEEIQFLGF